MSGNFFVDFHDHALQGLTRTTLCEVIGTVGNHILDTLCPAYRRGELSDQVGLDLSGIGMRLAIHILINGALRSLDLRSLDGCHHRTALR